MHQNLEHKIHSKQLFANDMHIHMHRNLEKCQISEKIMFMEINEHYACITKNTDYSENLK